MLDKVLFLATLNKVLVDYFTEPIQRRWPNLDMWWMLYVAGVTGAVMGWFSQIDLFTDLFPGTPIGRILTSILIGGGSSLIHKLFEGGVGALRSIVAKNWEHAIAQSQVFDTNAIDAQFVTGESTEPENK